MESNLRLKEVNFLVRISARMDFFSRVKIKIFHRLSQIVFFFAKATRLVFDRAQVLEWVLRSNFNRYLFSSLFLDNFDYPKICPFFEVVEQVINFILLYLKNK